MTHFVTTFISDMVLSLIVALRINTYQRKGICEYPTSQKVLEFLFGRVFNFPKGIYINIYNLIDI